MPIIRDKFGEDLKSAYVWLLVYAVFAAIIKVATFYPEWIENQYATYWYLKISGLLRAVFGMVPISVGDLLYGYWIILIIIILIDVLRGLIKRNLQLRDFHYASIANLKGLTLIYILFNVLWGFNYNRQGIQHQLKLEPTPYSRQELQQLSLSLVQKVNYSKSKLGSNYDYPGDTEIFNGAYLAYQYVAAEYPFLEYRNKSIKASLYGRLGNYLGFLGYFNPFSGEAQVNTTLPGFVLPFTTCHEIAHQLGYASESEASFVGYLAAKASDDPLFHYSAYLDLFLYANAEMMLKDSLLAKKNYQKLDPAVKNDIHELREFHRTHSSVMQPYTRAFYDGYLRLHNQPKGINSYSESIAWLISYKRQYKTL